MIVSSQQELGWVITWVSPSGDGWWGRGTSWSKTPWDWWISVWDALPKLCLALPTAYISHKWHSPEWCIGLAFHGSCFSGIATVRNISSARCFSRPISPSGMWCERIFRSCGNALVVHMNGLATPLPLLWTVAGGKNRMLQSTPTTTTPSDRLTVPSLPCPLPFCSSNTDVP